MTNIYLIITCILLVVIWLYVFKNSRKCNNKLAPILVGASFVHTAFLILLPTIYSVSSDFYFEELMYLSVTSDDILKVLIGELIFVFMFAIAFFPITFIIGKKVSNEKVGIPVSNRADTLVVKILIIAGLIVYLPKVMRAGFGENSLIVHLTTMFWYAPLVVAIFILIGRNIKINKFWYICSFAITFALVYITFQAGVRGRIFWILSLLMFAAFFYRRYKYLLISIPFLVVMVPIFSVLGTAETRFNVLGNLTSPLELVSSLYSIADSSSSSIVDSLNLSLESFVFRAQGVRNSVILYREHELGGGGFSIYIGALTTFIPSYLYPDKPILGSLSSSEDGFAMYRVIENGYGRGGEMGPFLASAHAYWEGGWLWLVFCGLITGLFWKYVLLYTNRLPEITKAIVVFSFGASFLIDGFMTMLSPIYTYIYMLLRSVGPILFIYFIFRSFSTARGNSIYAL